VELAPTPPPPSRPRLLKAIAGARGPVAPPTRAGRPGAGDQRRGGQRSRWTAPRRHGGCRHHRGGGAADESGVENDAVTCIQ